MSRINRKKNAILFEMSTESIVCKVLKEPKQLDIIKSNLESWN